MGVDLDPKIPPAWRPSRLAARIFVVGLIQFVVVALGIALMATAHHRSRPSMQSLSAVATSVAAAAGDPAKVREAVSSAERLLPARLAVLDDHDEPVAGMATSSDSRSHHPAIPIVLEDGRVWHLVVARCPFDGLLRALATLAMVLTVVGAAAWLTARGLMGSLTRLSAADAFGAGAIHAPALLVRAEPPQDGSASFDEMAERVTRAHHARKELLANVSNGSLSLRPTVVSLKDFLETTATRFRSTYPSRPLDVDLHPALPGVEVDAMLLRRAVDNLLDNAHGYTNEPSTPVSLAAWSSSNRVLIEVLDEGVGMDEADLARIFEPAFLADRHGGRGLGVLVARRIVEAHGGSLTFQSVKGKGTIAYIDLPAMDSRGV